MSELMVELNQGKHSVPAPEGTAEAIEELLKKGGFSGHFKPQLGKRIRGHERFPRVQVGNIDKNTFAILLKVQPDGKDSRSECILFVPGHYRHDPQGFFEKLQKAASSEDALASAVEGAASFVEDRVAEDKNFFAKEIEPDIVFGDPELLKITLLHIEDFFASEKEVEKEDLLGFLETLGLYCCEKEALNFFIKNAYLLEADQTVGNSKLKFGEKANLFVKKGEAELDMKLLESMLMQLKEEADKHKRISESIRMLNEKKNKIKQKLSEIDSQLEKERKELQEVSSAPNELKKILGILGIN